MNLNVVLSICCACVVCACIAYAAQIWDHRAAWKRLVGKRVLTLAELRLFDGSYGAPVYISLAGQVFDVSSAAADFYGQGKSYHVYAGRESGRALGHMSLGKPVHAVHLDHPLVFDLSERQQTILRDWIKKFHEKYAVVARLAEAGAEIGRGESPVQPSLSPTTVPGTTNSNSPSTNDCNHDHNHGRDHDHDGSTTATWMQAFFPATQPAT